MSVKGGTKRIPIINPNLTGTDLTAAINDRLRRASGLQTKGTLTPGHMLTIDSAGDLVDGGAANSDAIGGVSVKTASYLATAADDGKLLVFNSGSAVTLNLPAKAPSGKWKIFVLNIGAGTLTVSPNGLKIDTATSSLSLTQQMFCYIASDGANYYGEAAAPIASPAFTGIPTAPTAGTGTNTTQLATCAFVISELGTLVTGVSSVFGRTGAVVAQTGDYTVSQITGAAPIASPTFTGTPAAPTPTTGDNSTKVATTAFVIAELATLTLLKKYAGNFSASAGVALTITHSLGTTDVHAMFFDGSGNKQDPDSWQATNTTQITVTFQDAFSGRVVVMG